jgi:chromosome partitioning protein
VFGGGSANLETPAPDEDSADTRVIAVVNHKGGVGKTTTAINLGAWLALSGHRVLVVDLDPQANATTGLGVDPRRVSNNVYHILVDSTPVEDAIEPTAVRNLYCVPSTIDLAGAEIELVTLFSREMRLRKALASLDGEFDFILIDCPPSLGLLTVNSLAAATEVIVPIQCEYYALEGLGQLLKNVNLIQTNLNPDLRLCGIVLTMYDGRTRLSEQVANEVRSHFPGKVFHTVIPRSVRLSEAPSFGQPVALYDPKSRGSIAYEDLAAEVAVADADGTLAAPEPRETPQAPLVWRSAARNR